MNFRKYLFVTYFLIDITEHKYLTVECLLSLMNVANSMSKKDLLILSLILIIFLLIGLLFK